MTHCIARGSTAAVLLLGLIAIPLAGQQSAKVTARGTVIDAATSEPIAGAYVGVQDSRSGVPTNARGEFILTRVPVGATIEVTHLGYAGWTQRVDGSETLRIALRVDPIVMNALEVVTDRFEQRRRASGVASRSYTADQIIGAPVTDARDFALLRAPFGRCADGRGDCIYRRGRWRQPSICIDDFPYGSDVNVLATIPAHEIHRFELVGGTSIYVYTKHFAERLALGNRRLMPRLLSSNRAC
jgi:hypothetical protein